MTAQTLSRLTVAIKILAILERMTAPTTTVQEEVKHEPPAPERRVG